MTQGLDAIANAEGRFAILAMDQRGTLRSMLSRAGMPSADQDLRDFKLDVVGALAALSSGVLVDVDFGAPAVQASRALAPRVGVLIASEGYPQPLWNDEYRTVFSVERGPAFVRAAGGAALKFLVRWRPDRPAGAGQPDLAREAIDAVRSAVEACHAGGMPCVVEPLVAGLPGEGPLDAAQKRRLVLRSAELLAETGPDLLKLEWPADDVGCDELTRACGRVPWTLLSGGVAYDAFVERVGVAMAAGASGFIAGRAIWGEAVALTGGDRKRFLATTAAERMSGLVAATAGRGRSWRDVAAG